MVTATSDAAYADRLCDALARGRLCLAELALLDPLELEALHAIGVGRLDTDRISEAVDIFAALVSLYAYSAKYWRSLGVALHRARNIEAAMTAYRLSLHLEPSHIPTVGLLGELKLFCGLRDEALVLLERAAHSDHPVASLRALRLLGNPTAPLLPDMPTVLPPLVQTPTPLESTFELTGGKPLPMPHAGTDTAAWTMPDVSEVTDKIFLADYANARAPITQTAIVHRHGRPRATALEHSGTDTGIVERAQGGAPKTGGLFDFVRWFSSAARRRRQAEPLLDDETTLTKALRPR